MVCWLLATQLGHSFSLVIFKRVYDAGSAPLISAFEQLYLFFHFLFVLFALLLYSHLFPFVNHEPLFKLMDAEKLDEALIYSFLAPNEPLDVVARELRTPVIEVRVRVYLHISA